MSFPASGLALKSKLVFALLPKDTAAYLLSYPASVAKSSMFFNACFALSKLQVPTEDEPSKITTISSMTGFRLSLGLPRSGDTGMRRKFVNNFFAVSWVVGTFWNAARVFRYKHLVLLLKVGVKGRYLDLWKFEYFAGSYFSPAKNTTFTSVTAKGMFLDRHVHQARDTANK